MKKVNFFIKLHHAYLMWMSPKRVNVRYILAGHQRKGEIRERLKGNCVFYALLDIPLPEKQDLVPVNFLGETGMFPSSLVHLKHKSGAPFHVMYMVRDPKDWRKQTVVVTPELSFGGNVEEDLQQAVSELEKGIREYPHLWWGWGMVSRMRPEHIRKAQERKDYSTASG
jgi:lauroyl/myristoyl acyltransferase